MSNKVERESVMPRGEFTRIRLLTGCNREQYAKCFGFTKAQVRAFESGTRPITAEAARYVETIRDTYENDGEVIPAGARVIA